MRSGSPAYLTPDVAARFDTIDISQEDTDRVRIQGVKGEPPTDTTKVCINNLGGYRNSMTIVLTGLDIEKKAQIVTEALFDSLGGKEVFSVVDVQLVRSDKKDPQTNEEAFAHLRISVMDPDPKKVALFSSKLVEMALASIPGFYGHSPPDQRRAGDHALAGTGVQRAYSAACFCGRPRDCRESRRSRRML